MRIKSTLVSLFVLMVSASAQSQWVNLESTSWEDAPDIRTIEKNVHFKPEVDLGEGVRAAPLVRLDVAFRNVSVKEIKSVEFEIILFCRDPNARIDADLRRVRVEPFTYRDAVFPNEKGSFFYEQSVSGLTLPVRQTIRISQIEYADGSHWKRGPIK